MAKKKVVRYSSGPDRKAAVSRLEKAIAGARKAIKSLPKSKGDKMKVPGDKGSSMTGKTISGTGYSANADAVYHRIAGKKKKR